MIATRVFGGAAGALRIPLYRRYFTGHFLASIGRWMYRMSIGWLAWELTGSSVWLGAVAFADLAPTAILTIVAGAYADRLGAVRIIRMTLLLCTLLPGLLGVLVLTKLISIEMLICIAFLNGCVESFSQPARLSIINALVPKGDLPSAIALGSMSFNASRIVGPSLAGFVIVQTSVGAVMLLCSLGFLYFWLVMRSLRVDDKPAPKAEHHGLWADIVDGFRYTKNHAGISFVMILLTATSLFIRPVIEMLPGIADKVFHVGPQQLALLLGAIGVGAVTASFFLARRGDLRGLTSVLVTSTFGTGIAVALAMQMPSLWLASLCFAFMGVFMLLGNVSAQTLIQNNVSAEYRARVMGLFIMFGHGLPAVGALAQGALADVIGLQSAIGSCAIVMLAFWAWALWKRGPMVKLLEHPDR